MLIIPFSCDKITLLYMQEAFMEELEQTPQPEQPGYIPRPRWQVWLARLGLVLFMITLIGYYLFFFRGGQF
jgi:hypothetical protein